MALFLYAQQRRTVERLCSAVMSNCGYTTMANKNGVPTSTLSKEPVYWIGVVPKKCELSGKVITKTFVDGRVPGMTSWANMHPKYFKALGGTFGVGRGQLYEKQENGRWLKVEG
jgi:hypothetical protein